MEDVKQKLCLKCLKWHYWTVRSMKNVALLTEDGAFALFFLPHPGGFAIQGKKNANSRGSARGGGGWAQVELTDALSQQAFFFFRFLTVKFWRF